METYFYFHCKSMCINSESEYCNSEIVLPKALCSFCLRQLFSTSQDGKLQSSLILSSQIDAELVVLSRVCSTLEKSHAQVLVNQTNQAAAGDMAQHSSSMYRPQVLEPTILKVSEQLQLESKRYLLIELQLFTRLGMVIPAYNPSTEETDAGSRRLF